MNEPTPVVREPGEGKVLRAFGDEITVHLGGEHTGGRLTMLTDVTPPGSGPPPHYHENEDEWFMPLAGRVEFLLEGRWAEVAVGSVVFAPRRAVHTFRNVGDTPLETLIQLSPAGFEVFFERSAKEFARPGGPDMERIVRIGIEHGIHFLTEAGEAAGD